MRRLPVALLGTLVWIVAACSTSTNAIPGDDDDGGTGPSIGGSESDGGKKDAAAANDCIQTPTDPFVLSDSNIIYQFDPPTLTFTSKGVLNCATNRAPTSMAVDRQGTAWVRYDDGLLWKVDTKDLTCTATDFQPAAETDPFYKFGMGFATSSAGGSSESLFVSDNGGRGLAKLDLTTLKITPIGQFTGTLAGSSAELTGTGDGKLYGFFTTSPAQVAEISETTGGIVKTTSLSGVNAGNAWAFSFYGGDFYIYTDNEVSGGLPRQGSGGSDVTLYKPSDGSVKVVKPSIGFKIVGAGVSTCAPTTEGPK